MMTLFLHFFRVESGSKSVEGYVIIFVRKYTKYFEPYSNSVKNFKNHFFMVPLTQEAHLKYAIWI